MSRRTVNIIVGVVVLGLIVAGVAMAYIYFAGGSGEASEVISAPTLPAAEDAGAEEGGETTLFRIDPEQSEVRFIITEELRGVPTVVTGRTSEVAGDILVDFANPANTEVGTIRINVRTLVTDNEFRNRAIRGQILQSVEEEFEFSEFVPTALQEMPDTVTLGETLTFKIVGNLTVRDITHETTFDATVTPVSETELAGTAAATVQRADFELTIPNAPGVANVSEDVNLEIDFVALAVEGEGVQEAAATSG